MLWKNRDVSLPEQEIVYFAGEPYSFVSIVTAGDTTQAWGGVNSVGFMIEDATNLNTADTVAGAEDDGTILKLALRTCSTVSQFQSILDSTSVVGHTQPAIFGVIDAQGGASVFETFAHNYVRYDAADTNDAPHGFLVRSNFSYAGSTSGRIGVWRHDRAKELIEAAAEGDSLNVHYVCRTVARDLRTNAVFNPYPLPYEGQQGGLPWGWISTYGAVCRRLSVSGCVIEGILPGEDPLLSTMFAFPMAVQYGVAIPFWVLAGDTPPEVNGDSTAPLCDEGLRIKTLGQHTPGFIDTLDTYILVDGHGGGVHVMTFPLEDSILARTDSALAVWRTSAADSADMVVLEAELATMAFDVISVWPGPGDLWVPPRAVTTLSLYWVPDLGLRLRWNAVTEDTLGLQITPSGYTVWRQSLLSEQPDSLAFTTATSYVIEGLPADSLGFFEVRAVR